MLLTLTRARGTTSLNTSMSPLSKEILGEVHEEAETPHAHRGPPSVLPSGPPAAITVVPPTPTQRNPADQPSGDSYDMTYRGGRQGNAGPALREFPGGTRPAPGGAPPAGSGHSGV